MLWFQQAAISALFIAAALARSFLAFLRLVRTFRDGRNTLASTSSAIAARARIGRPTRAFHCPEDFLPTYRNATGCCTVAANTLHACYFAHLLSAAVDDLDGLEGLLLVHGVLHSGCPCKTEPRVACSLHQPLWSRAGQRS